MTLEIRLPAMDQDSADVLEILVAVGDTVALEQSVLVLESSKATFDVPADHAGVISQVHVSVGQSLKPGDLICSLAEQTSENQTEKGGETEPELNQQQGQKQSQQIVEQDAPSNLAEIRLPAMDQESADVLEVLVAAGDTLALEQSVLVLESSKATFDVPADHAGTVAEVLVAVGQSLRSGDLICTVRQAAGASASAGVLPQAEPAPSAPDRTHQVEKKPIAPVAPVPAVTNTSGNTSNKAHAGPAVRYLAREFGVDLSQVTGSGRKGRVLKEDISHYVRQRLQEPPQQSGVSQQPALQVPSIDHAAFGEVSSLPLNAIKRATAQAMTLNTLVPQVTHFDEVLLGTSMPSQLVARLCLAIARTLVEQPLLGASLADDQQSVVIKHYVNLGIAMDTPAGLMVPVLKGVDRLSVAEIQTQIGELQEKALARRLQVNDMSGATFTLSSLGKLGGTGFTALVVPPQVGILSVACSQRRLVLGQEGEVEEQLVVPLGLSYDHRVVDGAEAGRFMNALKSHLYDTLEDATDR